jgi:hypothetical protein
MTFPHDQATPARTLAADRLAGWIERRIETTPNRQLLQHELDRITTKERLLRFLHRFLLFNDALAARVPFLAGRLHLTQGVFAAPGEAPAFSRLRNGTIAAYVAEAASDEYRMTSDRNLVHQHLSQRFFDAVLAFLGEDPARFDQTHSVPTPTQTMLDEARTALLTGDDPDQLLAALGFHLGLEFFANEEFTLVDTWLRTHQPELVAALEQGHAEDNAYSWLTIHTVVEIHHYRAGLEAVKTATRFCTLPDAETRVPALVRHGLDTFVDLQRRFYGAILAE